MHGEESTASIPALLDAARRGDRAAAGELLGLSHEEAARRMGRGVGAGAGASTPRAEGVAGREVEPLSSGPANQASPT